MRILLIDDHPLFREGLALLLKPLLGDGEVLEAGTCEEAFASLEARGPADLVLMDLNLPGMSGLDGIATLHAHHPDMPVVALSSQDDKQTVLRALDAGAMGFIPKSSSSGVLQNALRLVMSRGVYLPPSVFLGDRENRPEPPRRIGNPDERHGAMRPSDLGLTPRQADVLYLLLQGKSAKAICRDLGLSTSTVKVHTSAVLRALNVTTRTQAVVAAGRLGLLFDRSPPK